MSKEVRALAPNATSSVFKNKVRMSGKDRSIGSVSKIPLIPVTASIHPNLGMWFCLR
ncbi:hypothetical protein N9W87_01060 [Schleiferiaceae bacterium]|nr:hypothetical protein [Schleiferiaceae bacterium]